MNKKSIYLSLSLFCLCTVVSAQSFNPRVEVTNQYQGKSVENSKNKIDVNVPDSLTVFDYDFDYSVFDNPYKGSYEFSPYLIDMRPEATQSDMKTFYLRAGAGYSLHPMAEIAFTPKLKTKNLSLQFYDNFKGYIGKYKTLKGYHMSSLGSYLVDNYEKGKYSGYDMDNILGAKVRYVGDKTVFSMEVTYKFMAVKDTLIQTLSPSKSYYSQMYNEGAVSLNFASAPHSDQKVVYDIDIKGRMGENDIDYNAMGFAIGNTELNAKADLGFRLGSHSMLGIDFGTDMGFYNRLLSSYVMNVFATPKYKWSNGRFNVNLGAQLAFLFGKDNTKNQMSPMHQTESQYIYPDVDLSYRILDEGLIVYAKAKGGNDINQYSSILDRYHFFNPVYMLSYTTMPLMDNTVTKIDASLGLKGQIGGYLQFDLYGGYADSDSYVRDGIYAVTNDNPLDLIGSLCYGGVKRYYGDVSLKWLSEHIEAGAHFRYTHQNSYKEDNNALQIPRYFADGYITYNWNKRIYAGVNVEYCSERSSYYVIPSYVDLGALLEYKFNGKFSVWLKGGNLLNRTIQRTPLHAEDWLNITGGISLNF